MRVVALAPPTNLEGSQLRLRGLALGRAATA